MMIVMNPTAEITIGTHGREVHWSLDVDYRKTVSIIFFKGLWGGIGAEIGTLQAIRKAQHQLLPQSIVYLGQFVRG